jgi:hypothetical protein
MAETNGAVFGGVAGFLTLCGTIYAAINHKHIRAKCCGHTFEMEIDVNPIEDLKHAATADKKKKKVHPEPAEEPDTDNPEDTIVHVKSHPKEEE